jgi:16S rRNA (cytosine1402-N4)-methyltransferase
MKTGWCGGTKDCSSVSTMMSSDDAGSAERIAHRAVMLEEVIRSLRPRPGETAVDCTLGGGGHARALLSRLQPGGRLLGIDVDARELAATEARLHDEGVAPAGLMIRHGNFADLPRVLADAGLATADVVLVDLGISAMQADSPRGFNFKIPGPLDMRMDPSRGEPASQLLARVDEGTLAALLAEHADEPHAACIAALLKRQPPETSQALERTVRLGLVQAFPDMEKADIKKSVRRTFQALRIAVNDELTALDALLRSLPGCLAPGGRVAILTFHSGEDRRVKKAFQAGHRTGVYAEIAPRVIRSAKPETFSNRRAAAAKLRWAVRG